MAKLRNDNFIIDKKKLINIPKTVKNKAPLEPIYLPNTKENNELIKGLINAIKSFQIN